MRTALQRQVGGNSVKAERPRVRGVDPPLCILPGQNAAPGGVASRRTRPLMHVLGISAFHRDSSAVLLRDGAIAAAAHEDRFTRTQSAHAFPREAVRWCLAEGGIRASDVEYVGVAEKPMWAFERQIESWIAFAPRGFNAFRRALPQWLGRRVHVARELDRELGLKKKPYVFAGHAEAHAAAAYFPSPFDEAAILVLDGAGEWATTTLGSGRANHIQTTGEIHFPHSLGFLYAAFVEYLGFVRGEGEADVMGLAAYGEPRFAALIREQLIDVKPDGSFWLDASYFRLSHGETSTSNRFHELFGGAPRRRDEAIGQRHKDLAASVQRVVEDVVLAIARHLHATTKLSCLAISGGVAANTLAIGRVVHEGPFERVWVQPAPGNAGTALGVALLVHHQLLGRERVSASTDRLSGALLGPRYSMSEIDAVLSKAGAKYTTLDDKARDERVAQRIAEGAVVAWFQGRAEFGARALGARSLLADPRRAELRDKLNARIAFRDTFREFEPSVLAADASKWFDVPVRPALPYTPLVTRVKLGEHDKNARVHNGVAQSDARRSPLPAVTHVDGTASVQTIDAASHPALAGLLRAFERATGCAVLLNSTLRLGSEPLVQSPADAWHAFLASEADVLVMENAIVLKSEQRAEVESRHKDTTTGSEQDDALQDLLHCPACGGSLTIEGERATCNGCAKSFAREEGIWRLFHPSEPYDGDITQLVKGFYEEHPFPGYDEDESLRSLMDKARKGVYARLLGEQLPPNARALEVGCGTGQLSNFLGLGCRTVVGADLCLNSLRLAEGFRARHDLRRVRFVQMNLFRPAFAPGSFDVVLCNGVLLTTTDPRGGFDSIAKLVKPGGHIVIGLYNTYGRLAVDSRRVFFRITGGRMRWVDPYLRKVRMSPEKEDAWFHDQYRHPHETKQTMGEVLGWFDANGFDFVSAVPKTNPWEPFSEREDLFAPTSRGTAFERGLQQAKMIVTSAQEGGFFIMIGKKRTTP